ncbi:MAG: B12-binding domain-containing radical SAM protein [Desulfomonile tiedjei]|nr:B12-binding domain-containing radical SAM protein [Desulfomonile tiedjei]
MAALLPAAWSLRLVDRVFQEITQDLWNWAEMVMISALIEQADDVRHLIREGKRRGKTVVVGGPYPTSVPEEVFGMGADFVVKGEAESSLSPFFEALASGHERCIIEEPSKPDLTSSPLPRFDLLDLDAYMLMSVQTTRGCPFDCEFCDIVTLYGRRLRHKATNQVIAELEYLHSLGWRREIFFADDNFIGSKAYARELLGELSSWLRVHRHPFGFWTQASLNLGQDKELIDLMTLANFSTVFIGIESPDEKVLEFTGKKQNLRNPVAESIQTINTNGLFIMGSFIIGFDNEEAGAGERIRRLVERTNLPIVMINILGAPPNTALWHRLEREGRLLEGVSHDLLLTAWTLNFVPARPAGEIIEEYCDLINRLYEPSAFLQRVYHYYLTMRPTRKELGLVTEKDGKGDERDERPLKDHVYDFVALLRLIWRQGLLRSTRIQFWRQLVGIYRNNPSRLRFYLLALLMGENLFMLRALELQRTDSAKEKNVSRLWTEGRGLPGDHSDVPG